MVGRAAGGGSVDRGDRTRGRPRPVHGVVLGAQARADVLARGAPRGAGPDRPRVAHGDRRLRALDPRHRGRVRTQPGIGSALATQGMDSKPLALRDFASAGPRSSPTPRAICGSAPIMARRHSCATVMATGDAAGAASSRSCGDGLAYGRCSSQKLAESASSVGSTPARARCSSITWIQGRSPSRSAMATRARSSAAPGGEQVRAPVRELPRSGRGGSRRSSRKIGRPRCIAVARYTAFRGSSIGRANDC